jgi:hypothetical protein
VQIEALEGRQLFSGGAAHYVALLAGGNEIPAIQSPGRGVAKFTLNRDGTSLRYKLKVGRMMNAEGGHIHLGTAAEKGEIVVDLMNSGPMRMGRKGFSAHGVLTAAQLGGSLAGHTLADLVARLDAGTAYVNVHSDDGVAPPNTGPGDFPDGEIRGQIARVGKRIAPGGQTGGTGGTGSDGGGTPGGGIY